MHKHNFFLSLAFTVFSYKHGFYDSSTFLIRRIHRALLAENIFREKDLAKCVGLSQ